MLAELYVLSGRDAGKLIDAVGPTIYLGRAATNHYRIRDPQASRVHCRIDITQEALTVQDAGSGNGTYVNEERLEGPRQLEDGDEIRVGGTRLKVLIETDADRRDAEMGSGQTPALQESDALETSAAAEVEAPSGELSTSATTPPAGDPDPGDAPGDPSPPAGKTRRRRRRALREVLPGYRLEARLGGHSHQGIAVYRAEQRSLGRPVTLKVFLPKGQTHEEEVDRFLREAAAIARLPHPNVVTVHDVLTRGRMRVIVTEYLAGGSLADRLAEGRALPLADVLDVGEGIARALGFLHGQGVVHRNVQPSNILLAPSLGLYKLGGFGFATGPATQRRGDTSFLDAARGEEMGFLAPEQLGADLDRVGPWTDVYSLGATLYACASGRAPFAGEHTVEVAAKVLRDPPPPLDESPRSLRTIIERCLHKDPTQRYSDASALLHELGACRATCDLGAE